MKTYNTKEECLKENGEHAWYKFENTSGISCLVYHTDGYCSHNEPVWNCYHCPARKVYTRTQAEIFEWVEY